MRFKSKIGLGQHVRHRHPDLANQKRIDAAAADINRKRQERLKVKEAKPSEPARASKLAGRQVWSSEEDELLRKLSSKHAGERFINVLIAKELPGKTNKQTSDRRRTLGLIGIMPTNGSVHTRQINRAGSQSVPQDGSVLTRQGGRTTRRGTRNVDRSAQEQRDHDDINLIARKLRFQEAIIKDGPSNMVGDSAEALNRATEGDPTYLEHENRLLEILRERCMATPSNKKQIQRRDKRRSAPKGLKAREKAKRFRSDQFLFANDRKGLASKILDGNEGDAKCDLEPEMVEEVYKERFGGVSQDVDLSAYPEATPVDKEALLRSFSQGEVKKAMRRAKKNTAAGPDAIRLEKAHDSG